MLKPGDIFKTATGDVWYCDTLSASGAYCIHLSAHPTPITTRKRVTKVVKRHLRNTVFSLDSLVDFVDPSKLDQIQLRRRLAMARKEGTVETSEDKTAAPAGERRPVAARATQKFARTEKALAKELRGQGKETMDAIVAAGKPVTAAEVAAVCTYAGSRQDKERVAGYYLSQFKKDGYLVVVADTPAPVPA